MAASVTKDLVNKSPGRLTQHGWELTRIFLVENMTAGSKATRIPAAKAEFDEDIGDAYPGNSNVRLEEIRPEVITPTTYKFHLIYRQRLTTENAIEVRASANQVTTNLDKDDKPMLVTFGGKTQTAEASIIKPFPTLVVTRNETDNPWVTIVTYVGKVNDAAVTIDGVDYPARSLLVADVYGVSHDAGISYDMTWTIQHDPDDWDVEAVWIDPATGRMPAGILDADGGVLDADAYKTIRAATEVDMSGLNLTNSWGATPTTTTTTSP